MKNYIQHPHRLTKINNDKAQAHQQCGDGKEFTEDGYLRKFFIVMNVIGQHHHNTTGGDTGRAIMDASGIRAMSVDGAVAPGIPLITTRNGPRRHIVTKAGGFGAPDALVTAMAFLTEGRLSS